MNTQPTIESLEQDIAKLRALWSETAAESNRYRDALKEILALCEENRRGNLEKIRVEALTAFGAF